MQSLLVNESLRSLLRNPYAWVVLIAFTIRLTTLGLYPLGDTTEARYSEMARKMVETGNWITPQFDYGVPFWGKPPLTIWLHAASFKVFGMSEFTARMPSVFISLLIVALVFYLARQQHDKTVAWMASALLTTSVLFFILSGSVIMDPLMTLGTTLSMLAFWLAIKNHGQYWGYLFFIGLAIGLMSKGPVAVVLTTIPVIVWLTMSGNWQQARQTLPLFSGTILMLALTLPWYIVAEYATPGFLDYFILGEHWARFTQPGWQGDLYGSAHANYIGAIWVKWLIAAFPLSIILIAALLTLLWRKKSAAISNLCESWSLYLILWTITPMVFFTFSGNILATYVLPGLPAAAILVAGLGQTQSTTTQGSEQNRKSIAVISKAGLLFPLLFLAVALFHMPNVADHNSEKFLIEKYRKVNNSGDARLIYLYKRPFSAEYYSNGKAEVIHSVKEIHSIINQTSSVFFAIPFDNVSQLSINLQHCLHKLGRFGRYVLFQRNKQICKN